MNPDKLKIFREEFDKSKKDWWLSKQEEIKLEKLFNQIPKDKQDEFLAQKENLSEPLKSFVEWLKNKINSLKEDVEKNSLKWGFEELKNNFENSEIAWEFFELIESYIDLKLEKSFSKVQKDKIKLALLWEIESGFNLSAVWEWLMNKVLKPLKQKIDKLKWGDFDDATDTKDIPWMSEIENSMTEMFEDFWLDLKVKELDEKINKLNEKKDSWEITNLKSVLTIINPDNASNITFDTIKTKTQKLVWLLGNWKNIANWVQKGLEKLPFGLWDMISNWIKSTIKKGWILWMILWFFFWKEFMDESAWKQKQSLTNLEKFSKNDNFPLNENIKFDEIQKLEPKKLEKFYKYLDLKDIDYTSEKFWQELLTWKSKNKKVIEVYELLKNEDWKILTEKQDLWDLVSKLNWLEKFEGQQEQQEVEQHNQKIQQEIQQKKAQAEKQKKAKEVLVAVASAKTKEEKEKIIKKNKAVIEDVWIKAEEVVDPVKTQAVIKKVEAQVQQTETQVQELESKKEKTFEEYLVEWKIKVWDKLESISVDEQNHILKIGENSYKIKIDAWYEVLNKWVSIWDKLEKISFNDWIITIVANWDKKIFWVLEVKWLLKELLAKWGVDKKIPKKLAKLVIKKV